MVLIPDEILYYNLADKYPAMFVVIPIALLFLVLAYRSKRHKFAFFGASTGILIAAFAFDSVVLTEDPFEKRIEAFKKNIKETYDLNYIDFSLPQNKEKEKLSITKGSRHYEGVVHRSGAELSLLIFDSETSEYLPLKKF